MSAVPVPLAASLLSRDGGLLQDAMILNGFISPASNRTLNVHKRPGLSWTQSAYSAGIEGNGIYTNLGVIYEVRGIQFKVNGTVQGTFSGDPASSKCWFASTSPQPTIVAIHSEVNNVIYVWDGTFTENDLSSITTSRWVGGFVYLDGTWYVMNIQGNIYGSPINDPSAPWDGTNVIKAQIDDGAAIGLWKIGSYIVAFSSTTATFLFDAGNPTGSPLNIATANFSRVGCYDSDSVAEIDDSLYFLNQDDTGYIKAMVLTNGGGFSDISTPDVSRVFRRYTPTGVCVAWSTGDRRVYMVQLNNFGYAVYDISMKEWYFWGFYGQDVAISSVVFTQDVLDVNTYTSPYVSSTDTVTTPFIRLIISSLSFDQYVPIQSWSNNTLTFRWPLAALGASFTATVATFTLSSSHAVRLANWTNGYLQGSNGERGVNNFSSSQDTYALLSGTTTSPGYFMVRTQSDDFGTQNLKTVSFLDIIGDRGNQASAFLRNSDDDFQSIVGTTYGVMSARYRIMDFGSFEIRGYELINVDSYMARFNSIRMELKGESE